MKKFKLTHIRRPDPDGVHTITRLYSIYLAPGSRHHFKSFRAANDFAARYSRDVNQLMHLYNHHLSELYIAHRATWFYYFDRAKGKNDLALQHQIEQAIIGVEKALNQTALNSEGTWAAGRAFDSLLKCSKELEKGFCLLEKYSFARRLFAQSAKLRILAEQTRLALQRLADTYGISLE